jgi:hypothetical protein
VSDIIGIALDLHTDACSVAFYVNGKFSGKHTFARQNIPGGKIWAVVACSSGHHQAEILPRHSLNDTMRI